MDDALNDENKVSTPVFLNVLCILTMLNGAYGMFSGVVNAVSPPDVDERMIESVFSRLESLSLPLDDVRGEAETFMLNTMLNIGNIAAANFLFYGMSLIAALLMINRNKVGFALYVAAQIGLAFIPSFFGGFNVVGKVNFIVLMVWNGIWIAAYASQRKHLR